MKEKKEIESKERGRGGRNGDEGRDDNWASFATVSVCVLQIYSAAIWVKVM